MNKIIIAFLAFLFSTNLVAQHSENYLPNEDDLKEYIKQFNRHFELYETYESIYSDEYLRTREYKKLNEENFKFFNKAQSLAKVVLLVEASNSRDHQIFERIYYFNINMLTLDSITKNVYEQAYNKQNVDAAIYKIKQLPELFYGNSRLNMYKKELLSLLENYDEINCIAYKHFQDYSNRMGNSKQSNTLLENQLKKGLPQSGYPFIQKVYNAIMKDARNFNLPEYKMNNEGC